MLRDIMRFNAQAEALAGDGSMTIREFLAALGAGAWFRDYYLLPLSGAIWSTGWRVRSRPSALRARGDSGAGEASASWSTCRCSRLPSPASTARTG
jgi:hypothetical protein